MCDPLYCTIQYRAYLKETILWRSLAGRDENSRIGILISDLAEVQYFASRIHSRRLAINRQEIGWQFDKAVWEVTAVQCGAVGEWASG